MAVTDQQKLDFLLKKIGFTKTKTGSTVGTGAISGTPKQPFAEAIPSPLIIANGALWNESDQITTTPPGSDTDQIKVYSASSALRMTADATSSGQRAYIAYSTYNDTSSTRLTNWIDTQFGALYLIKVYKGDPNSGGVALSAGATNENWFFDYSAGVLNFNDSNVPSGVTDTNIYIVGYRYIGKTGAPTSGISTFSFKDLTVERNLDVGPIGGISTFRNNIDLNANLDVSGSSTFTGNIDANGDLDVDGHTNLDNVSVAGVSTFASRIYVADSIIHDGDTDTKISFPSADTISFETGGSRRLQISNGGIIVDGTQSGNNSAILYNGTGFLGFYASTNSGVNRDFRFFPSNSNSNESLRISSNGNVYVYNDLDVDGHTNLDNISVAGVSTFTGDATFSGNVSIGGTLTYEDVTNVDSVGLLTARSGIRVTGGVIEAQDGENKIPSLYANMAALPSPSTYHGMFAHVHSTGRGYFAHGGAWYELVNADLTGRVGTGTESYFIDRLVSTSTTATSLNVVGVTTAVTVDINGDLDVDGHTNLDNVSVAGVTTFAGNIDANGNLDVDGTTNLDDVFVSQHLRVTNGGGLQVTGITTSQAFRATGGTVSITDGGVTGTVTNAALVIDEGTRIYTKEDHNGYMRNLIGKEGDVISIGSSNTGFVDEISLLPGNAGPVKLFHGTSNTSPKLATTSTGVQIVGKTDTDTLLVSGASDLNGDLDVDGHTNLDNVNIVGVTTHEGHVLPSADSTYDLGSSSKYWRHVYADNVTGGGGGVIIGDDIITRNLKVNGISTFIGIATFNNATFHDDVTFTTANNKNIVFDKSANDLTFGDSVIARFGDSNDLSVYHDSSSSNIVDAFGSLNIKSNVLTLRASDNSKYIEALNGSTTKLYFANNEKLSTTNTGINVTGLTDTDTFLSSGNATFSGTITAGGATGTNGQYLKSTGSGVAWATFPTARTSQAFTASAGQTTFSFSYTVGLVDVFVNGIKLSTSEFTATNGSSVVLAVGCFVGDIVEILSYNTATGGGGGGTLSNIVEDTTPQLGGNLDLFNKTINGTGSINITGVVTATQFKGDGSGLTGIVASGSGVVVKDGGSTVGTAGTINFGDNLSVSAISAGIVTITGFSGITTTSGVVSIANDLDVDGHTELDNVNIVGVTTHNGQAKFYGNGGAPLIWGDTGYSGHLSFDGSNNAVIRAASGKALIFQTNHVNTRMTIGSQGNVSIEKDLDVDGHTNLDNVSVAGVTTFAGNIGGTATFNNIDVDGHTELDNVNIAGVVTATTFKGAVQATSGTFSSGVDVTGDLDVDGHTDLDNVSVAGVSTFAGITTVTGDTLFTKQFNVSGISTFNNDVHFGLHGAGNPKIHFDESSNLLWFKAPSAGASSSKLWLGNGTSYNNLQLQTTNTAAVVSTSYTKLELQSASNYGILLSSGNGIDFLNNAGSTAYYMRCVENSGSDQNVELHYGQGASSKKFETSDKGVKVGTGVTIETNGQATYTGIVTAQKFVGDGSALTGISGSGGVTVQDEGSALSTQASTLNFVGTGVVASGTGATKTITINTGVAQTALTSGNSKVFVNSESTTSNNGSFEVFLQDNTSSGAGHTAFKIYQPTDSFNRAEFFSDNTANISEIKLHSLYAGSSRHRIAFDTNNSNYAGLLDFVTPTGQWNFYSTYQGTQKQLMGFNYDTISVGTGLMFPITNNGTDLGSSSYKWRQFHVTGVNAGVVTATTFHGDGSNLTGISAGTDVGITTNLSGSFTASAGSPSTINTFGYGSGDIVVEYTVFIKNGSNFQSQKLLAMRDGTTIHSTQFAVMFSSSLLVQLDTTISGGNILLRATPETGVSGSTTYKVKREVM